jgi:hypothetical protein
MRPVFRRFLPLLVLPLSLAACGDNAFEPSRPGTMSIMLTDAPGDFLHAIVTISSVELLGDGETIVLSDQPVTVNLLDLQNEVMVLVGETPVPAGDYDELRLVITDGLIEVEEADGSTSVYASSDAFASSEGFTADGQLQMPSFGSSGLKIKLPAAEGFVDGDDNAVLIDFNVGDSFGHQAGNSGRWILHPVIHATGFTTTGSVRLDFVLGQGVTLPTIDGTQITMAMLSSVLDRNGDLIPVTFTDTDGDGTWSTTFRFLPPGDWTIGLGLPTGLVLTTDPAFPQTFTVASGQTVTRSFTITGASIQP